MFVFQMNPQKYKQFEIAVNITSFKNLFGIAF